MKFQPVSILESYVSQTRAQSQTNVCLSLFETTSTNVKHLQCDANTSQT